MIGSYHLVLAHDRSGRHDRALPELGPIEHHRAHADQAPGRNRAAMDHGVMADRDIIPDADLGLAVYMHGAVVLDIAVLSDADGTLIGPQHGPIPDAGTLPDLNIPDHHGRGRNEHALGDLRRFSLIRTYHDSYQ